MWGDPHKHHPNKTKQEKTQRNTQIYYICRSTTVGQLLVTKHRFPGCGLDTGAAGCPAMGLKPGVLRSSLSPVQVPLSYLPCSLAENSSVKPHDTIHLIWGS